MCWITKKAHQKAIAELTAKYDRQISVLHGKVNKVFNDSVRYSDAGNVTDLKDHIGMYHHQQAPPTEPALFDPKTEPYPTEKDGMKLGFATVKDEGRSICLWYADGTLLTAYENSAWGNNTEARRIIVNPSRLAVAVNRKGTDYHLPDNEPRPFPFDDGELAYEVCPGQAINNHIIGAVGIKLYLKVDDVKKAWLLDPTG